MGSSEFDALAEELERDHPEEMKAAREWVREMLSTDEGRAAVLSMFIPIEKVLQQ